MKQTERTISEKTANLVSSLEHLLSAEGCVLSYYSEVYGDELGDGYGPDLFQKSGIPELFDLLKEKIKLRLGDSVEYSLSDTTSKEI